MSYKFTPATFQLAPKPPQILSDMLAIDAVARAHGCGLHPKLRELLKADAAPVADLVAPPPEAE